VPAALTLAALVLLAAAGAARQDPPRQAPTETVRLDAAVVDRSGRPVLDLAPGEFEVFIGGYRVPILELDAPPSAADPRRFRSITLILDDVTLSPIAMARAREVARRFAASIDPGDQMSVLPLSGGVARSTADPAALGKTIDAINTRATSFMNPSDLGAHVLGVYEAIARQEAETSPRRRAIIAIGTGGVFDRPIPPPFAGRELRPEWTSAARAIAAGAVVVYVVDPGGVGASLALAGDDGFARDTGGHAFTNTNDVAGVVTRIMHELSTYYTLTVEDPPSFRKSPLREVDVRVKRSGVTVRARRLIAGRS
jgi:VWFA-related protein